MVVDRLLSRRVTLFVNTLYRLDWECVYDSEVSVEQVIVG